MRSSTAHSRTRQPRGWVGGGGRCTRRGMQPSQQRQWRQWRRPLLLPLGDGDARVYLPHPPRRLRVHDASAGSSDARLAAPPRSHERSSLVMMTVQWALGVTRLTHTVPVLGQKGSWYIFRGKTRERFRRSD